MMFRDVRKDPKMQRLFILMGIEQLPELPEISFVQEKVFQKWDSLLHLSERKITETLLEDGIDIEEEDLEIEQGVLTYKGRKVLVYIQEQEIHQIQFLSQGYRIDICFRIRVLQDTH